MSARFRVVAPHGLPQRAATLLHGWRCTVARWLASNRLAPAPLLALGVIAGGGLLRLALILALWPASDSDESTMGIMALHIAAHTDFPIFLYGQPYMGALEAYLAAGAFHLFGPSLTALRLGMVVMATLWLGIMYLLGRALYTPSLALFCCSLLAIGPPEGLYRELFAGGGYCETLLASALLIVLAAWLARTSSPVPSSAPLHRLQRLGLFATWGLVAGLGVWSDTLVLPFALCSGLLLAAFCWREWRAALPCLLGGVALGALPLLIYAVTAPGHNPLAGAFSVQRSSNVWSGNVAALLIGQVTGTLLVAVPITTGGASLCPLPTNASWPLAHATPHTLLCTGVHGVLGLGYVALLGSALLMSVRAVRRVRAEGDRDALAREGARLALLAGAALTLLLFVTSPVAARSPNVVMRYLIGLLDAMPAVFAPLWSLAASLAPTVARLVSPRAAAGRTAKRMVTSHGSPLHHSYQFSEITCSMGGLQSTWIRVRRHFSAATVARNSVSQLMASILRAVGSRWRSCGALVALVVVAVAYLAGSVAVAQAVPQASATNQRQHALAAHLTQRGVTRVYSDYWTCNWLIFDSREHIICAVVDAHLGPGFDRFLPYRALVHEDPTPAFVFPLDSEQEVAFVARLANTHSATTYQTETFQGYAVYWPV